MPVDIETRDTVLDAFRRARVAGQEPADCYHAAIEAWCELHPEHDHTQAAEAAVKIVHDSFGALQELTRE